MSTSTTTSSKQRGREWWATWTFAAAALPTIFVALHTIGRSWYPTGDEALLLMRTSEAFTNENSFLGPYSRYGWSHPGPLLFWLYAIPYRLTGGASWSLLVAAASVSAASVIGLLVLAWREGRLLLLSLVGLAVTVIAVSLGAAVLQRPWNPYVTLLPFAFFIVSTWVVRQRPTLLPLNLLVGTFLVQTHVGFGLMVAAMWCLVLWSIYRNRPSRRILTASFVALGACWAPVLLNQLFGSGNAWDIVSFFASSDNEVVGFADALGIVSRELGVWSPWLGGEEPNDASGQVATRALVGLVAPLLVFGLGALVALKRRDALAWRLQLAVLVVAVAGFLSLSRVTDGASFYLVRYWWVVAMLWWVSTLWSLVRAIERPLVKRVVAGLSYTGIGALAVFSISDTLNTNVPTPRMQEAMATITAAAVKDLKDEELVFVEERGPTGGWVADGLVAQLEINRIDVAVSEERAFKLPNNVAPAANATAHVVVATGDSVAATMALPGARVLATYMPPMGLVPDLLPDGEGPDPEVTILVQIR